MEAGELALAVLAPIRPLRHKQKKTLLPSVTEEQRIPEPALLYGLASLALILHSPAAATGSGNDSPSWGFCDQCSQQWPCPQIRLAFRIREEF